MALKIEMDENWYKILLLLGDYLSRNLAILLANIEI